MTKPAELSAQSTCDRPYRITSLPGRTAVSSYVNLFYEALAPYGVELVGQLTVDRRWLKQETPKLDAIHIHWPEWFLYKYELSLGHKALHVVRTLQQLHIPGSTRLLRLLRTAKRLRGGLDFRAFLDATRRAGLRIIWTFHNAEAHTDPDYSDRVAFRMLSTRADLVICHSESARNEYLRTYGPPRRLVVMPIGNYESVFLPARPRDEVLQDLGLRADIPVLCCVGRLRGNKGLDIAVEAVARLDHRVQLIIGGSPDPRFDTEDLRAALSSIPGTVLISRRLSEQEVVDILVASNVALLPYRKVTGSAALMSAITLGRGVVASDLPYFREILQDEPDAGVLVEPGNAAALAAGVECYLAVPSDVRQEAALRLSNRYQWPKVVGPVGAVLQEWASQRQMTILVASSKDLHA